MRRLSRINGYKDSQVKRFNEMYENVYEDVAEGERENRNALVLYSQAELDEFRSFLVLAEVDERKRSGAMRLKRSLNDFTPEEIERFDYTQDVLSEFNRLLDDEDIDIRVILPPYSDIEMMELSQYRELWLANEANQL